MATMKTVDAGSYQAVDLFESTHQGFNNGTTWTNIKAGASGASTNNMSATLNPWPYQSGYPEGTARWEIDAGNKYYTLHKFGGSFGRFLGNQVTGLTFKENNNSTAGHGIYIHRYGLEIVNNSGTTELYDLSGGMGRPGSYGKTHSKTFNSTLQGRLNSGWYIYKFLVSTSTAGGTGSRKTQTTIEDLKFYVKSGPSGSGWKMILPVKRNYSSRSSTNWIA